MKAGARDDAKSGSWLDCREVISAECETDPSPAASPVPSPAGRPSRAARKAACLRRRYRRIARNKKTTPATLPTTPPTILFVVGLGLESWEGGLVVVGPGTLEVADVPKPPPEPGNPPIKPVGPESVERDEV